MKFRVMLGILFFIGVAVILLMLLTPIAKPLCAVPPVTPKYTGKQYDPVYHGADLLVISPDGSMSAYKWDRRTSTFSIMWKRKGK